MLLREAKQLDLAGKKGMYVLCINAKVPSPYGIAVATDVGARIVTTPFLIVPESAGVGAILLRRLQTDGDFIRASTLSRQARRFEPEPNFIVPIYPDISEYSKK